MLAVGVQHWLSLATYELTGSPLPFWGWGWEVPYTLTDGCCCSPSRLPGLGKILSAYCSLLCQCTLVDLPGDSRQQQWWFEQCWKTGCRHNFNIKGGSKVDLHNMPCQDKEFLASAQGYQVLSPTARFFLLRWAGTTLLFTRTQSHTKQSQVENCGWGSICNLVAQGNKLITHCLLSILPILTVSLQGSNQ